MNIKDRRIALKLTQAACAAVIGVNRQTYAKHEAENGANLFLGQGKKLAELFRMPHLEFVYFVLNMKGVCHYCHRPYA